jgi:hypothetical protein
MTVALSSFIITGGRGVSSPVLVVQFLVGLYCGQLPCCLPGHLQHSFAKWPGLLQ